MLADRVDDARVRSLVVAHRRIPYDIISYGSESDAPFTGERKPGTPVLTDR